MLVQHGDQNSVAKVTVVHADGEGLHVVKEDDLVHKFESDVPSKVLREGGTGQRENVNKDRKTRTESTRSSRNRKATGQAKKGSNKKRCQQREGGE